ncbi:MAG: DUF2357 domain-containing protein [Candidatus Sulfotelmatobacter sp.]
MAVPLHRIRLSWPPSTHIDIEWAKGQGAALPGFAPVPTVTLGERELAPDDDAARGVPAICWRDDTPVLFERLHLRENTDYFIDVTLPIPKAEAERQAREKPAWPFSERLRAVFKPDPARRWKQPDLGSVVVTGQIRLRNHAGILDLSTETGAMLRAEVVCRKIDYLHEFQTLLTEVAEFLAELLLQYDSPVSVAFDLTDARRASLPAMLFQMRYVMAAENLPLAIEELLSQTHTALLTEIKMCDTAEVEEPSVEALVDDLDVSVFDEGGPLAGLFRGYTPRAMPVAEVVEITDTPENRYVKYFLEECTLLAQWLATNLRAAGKAAVTREAEAWVLQLQELLAHDMWRGVGMMHQFPSNSQVLLRRRGYRDVLRFDLSLRLSLTLPWSQGEKLAEGLTGDIRPVSELYEYWCFFLMRRVLAELCQAELLDNGSFLSFTADGLQVRLVKGKRSRVTFFYRQTATTTVKLALYYNRRFLRPARNLAAWEGSYTATFDPDYSVAIIVTNGAVTQKHWLHFDAKYRLEPVELSKILHDSSAELMADADDDELGYEQEISRLHRREDLFKMHTYRDGILSTRGAYILFPGDGVGMRMEGKTQNFFIRHPSTFKGPAQHSFPSVGAFDLCPGRDEMQLPMLKAFLAGVIETVATGAPYQEEEGMFE